jgi:hypothetical protein
VAVEVAVDLERGAFEHRAEEIALSLSDANGTQMTLIRHA